MEVARQSLQQTLNGANRYTIPLFQRHYSWSKENWEKLWEDITELRETEAQELGHFMGTLVFVPEKLVSDRLPAFQVIDGQQRLTTLTLLLCALRNRARESENSFADEMTESYLVHKFKVGDERFRVYPRHRDRLDFEAAIQDGGTPHGQIQKALEFFAKKLDEDTQLQTLEGLRKFVNVLVSRLSFVHITLDKEESPYRIFRSLNSTGVDLSEADLIRNFMFMHVESTRQEDFDRKKWEPLEKRFDKIVTKKDGADEAVLDGTAISAFHRTFLMRDGKYIGPAATFETFERRYNKPDFDAEELTRTLEDYATLYDAIRGKSPHVSSKVAASLEKLRDLDTSTSYPLALNLLARHKNGALSEVDLVSSLDLLSGFVLRRYVCGESSRSYGKLFVSACAELGDSPLTNLRHFLVNRGFPENKLFKERFQTYDLYNSGYAKAVLKWLEVNHPKHSAKEAVDLSFKHIEIEHVMPQTLSEQWRKDLGEDSDELHQKWLHTSGNLTLTGYNQEFGNRPFSQKRAKSWKTSQGETMQGYAGSNIALTREVGDYTQWTEKEISARGAKLADLAAKIWVAP